MEVQVVVHELSGGCMYATNSQERIIWRIDAQFRSEILLIYFGNRLYLHICLRSTSHLITGNV